MKLIRDIKAIEKDIADLKYVLIDIHVRLLALEKEDKANKPKTTKKKTAKIKYI